MRFSTMSAIAAVLCAGALCVSAADVKVSGMPAGVKVAKIDLKAKSRTTNGGFVFTKVPDQLKGLQIVTISRGAVNKPGAGFTVTIDQPATVYLLVHDRGTPKVPADWKKTPMKVQWNIGSNFTDSVYEKQAKAGKLEVPAHDGKDGSAYGIPNALVIKPAK